MARPQRVELAPLSILTLTDQLVSAIEDSRGGVQLKRRADWLVMGSQLLLLKAQLLAPASPEARRRLELLDEFARMRVGAEWIAAWRGLGGITGTLQQSPEGIPLERCVPHSQAPHLTGRCATKPPSRAPSSPAWNRREMEGSWSPKARRSGLSFCAQRPLSNHLLAAYNGTLL